MKRYETMREFSLKAIPTDFPCVKISCSYDALKIIKNFYHDDILIYESFFILLLDRSNKTTGFVKISQGGITGTVVDVKLICKYAVETLSSGLICCHNHPSGNTEASTQDVELTNKLKSALKLIDCNLLDHLIITEKEFLSMADEGII